MKSRSLEELAVQLPDLKNNPGFTEIVTAIKNLSILGYNDYIEFNPTVIRGFDYYDGLVFEVFDRHPDNNRAIFGGGRYNSLAEIFGEKNFPAVGFAPGDETTKLFLISWNLLDKIKEDYAPEYYLPLLNKKLSQETALLAKKLRSRGFNLLAGLEEQKITRAIELADKKKIKNIIIFNQDEADKKIIKIKNLNTGQEKEEKF